VTTTVRDNARRAALPVSAGEASGSIGGFGAVLL